jgi:hypothetical protein
MMMAIYVADPTIQVIDEKISRCELYERLLTHFAEREAAKSHEAPGPEDVRRSVDTQLRHLSIAALGMFNRGRQDISAKEIGGDLAALEKLTGNTADAGHSVLGKFFFVYVAEARFAGPDSPDRRYEFLHATFGEYLVARLIVEELVEVAAAAFSSRRGVREPDDNLLFALLSFQALPTRLPILAFAEEICAGLDEPVRDHLAEMLTTLLDGYRDRHGSDKYQDYQPKSVDRVRELAAYSANLVLLRVAVDVRTRVPIFEVVRDPQLPGRAWESMLSLWQAGLDVESYGAVLSILVNDEDHLRLSENHAPVDFNSQLTALLAGDRHLAAAIRYGYGFTDHAFDARAGDDWTEVNYPWLAVALADWFPGSIHSTLMRPPQDADPYDVGEFIERLAMLVKTHADEASLEQAEDFARLLIDHRSDDPIALASIVIAHPSLIKRMPELDDPDHYSSPAAELIFRTAFEGKPPPSELEKIYRKLQRRSSLGEVTANTFTAVRQLMSEYRLPAPDPSMGRHLRIETLTWDPDENDTPQP